MRARTVAAASIALLGTGLLVACSVLAPLPQITRLEGRLQAFPTSGMPLDRPVTIHWDDHQIPFVVAETDGDAAFALGLVQGGWINSTTFADQVAPFMSGDLIRVPLRPSSISAAFRQRIHLLPDR